MQNEVMVISKLNIKKYNKTKYVRIVHNAR